MKTTHEASVSVEDQSSQDISGKDLRDGENPPALGLTWITAYRYASESTTWSRSSTLHAAFFKEEG